MIRKLLAAAALILTAQAPAIAQSGCPYIVNGAVLTAAQWNACFAAKNDNLGFVPLNRAGGTMLGPLITAASQTTNAGFRLPAGAAPTSPTDGDTWTTTSGMFVRINGVTIGPLTSSGGVSFAATAPLAVSFPSSVVTYALNIDSRFAVSGGNLALASISAWNVIANATSGSAEPGGSTLTSIIDGAIGSTQGQILYRNATVWTVLATGTAGDELITGGAAANPSWRTLTPGANGGTGVANTGKTLTLAGTLSLPAVVQGDVWFGSAASTISALAKDTNATRYLSNTGTSNNPAWAQVSLSTGVSGTIQATNFPALTGDVTTSAGSLATTIAANAVTNAKLAQAAAFTLKGNTTGSTANVSDFTIGGLTQKVSPAGTDVLLLQDQAASGALKFATVSSIATAGSVSSIDSKTGAFTTSNGLDSTGGNVIELTAARRTLPTVQDFTSGTNATYTRASANVLWIEVWLQAGGGGGGGGDNGGTGGTGGSTCWNTSGTACTSPLSAATGGIGGDGTSGTTNAGAGGATSGTCNRIGYGNSGAVGNVSTAGASASSGGGGAGAWGGGSGTPTFGVGGPGTANSGGGGAGGGASIGILISGGGGGGGGGCYFIINSPASTYVYTVGAGGGGASGGGGGSAGGNGGTGRVTVIEHYGT